MERSHDRGHDQETQRGDDAGGTPGKRARTERLPVQLRSLISAAVTGAAPAAPAPARPSLGDDPFGMHLLGAAVQRRGAGGGTGVDVHEAAARGVAGSGSALPHKDAIQRSFGRHDVGGVVAHTDDQARGSALAIGAQAYATGHHVAFAGAPDLHTAAHEAAHVVQQRAGVHLKGGVGEDGDVHERHADAVADAVVAGRSAESLLDGYAGGGAASPGVQRKLVMGDGTVHAAVGTLGLGHGQKASPLIQHLVTDGESSYLGHGVTPNFETATELKILRASKYVLGETHGDGTWTTRTAGWANITKMREGVKGFRAEDSTHAKAIEDSHQDQVGVEGDEGLPLEDMNHYAVGALVLVQQMLNDYDTWKSDPEFAGRLEEAARVILYFAQVGSDWFGKLGKKTPKEGSRPHTFMKVGMGNMGTDGWKVMSQVAVKKTLAASALSKTQRTQVQGMIESTVADLLALIDRRTMGGGFLGIGQSKQGPDPIANRGRLDDLSKPSSTSDGVSGVREPSRLREQAMIENIKAGPAPLLVQIGNEHVDRVAGAVDGSVAVKKGMDLDAMITVRGPAPTQSPQPTIVAPTIQQPQPIVQQPQPTTSTGGSPP